MSRLTRRHFLRGTGVAVSLPFLESFAQTAPVKSRFVGINIPLGLLSEHFFPSQTGFDYEMSPYLKLAESLRDQFTVISGTSHPEVDGGHAAERSFLTAAPHPGSRSFKNSVSLDQLLASQLEPRTRFTTLPLGEHSLAWSSTGVPIPAENNPAKTYAKLFLNGTPAEVERQKGLLSDGHSILDTILEDAKAMDTGLSHLDRQKMDQFFTAVRETEQRLERNASWIDTPKPEVSEPMPEKYDSGDVVATLRSHFDVIRLALQTDSTRIVTLGGANHSLVVPIQGVDMGYHALTHHGRNPEMMRQLELIDRETIKAWVNFITSLRDTSEGESSLLDQTQVFLGSNLGNANGHLNNNLPVLLAGGGWKHGQHLAFDSKSNTPLPNLFVSMAQRMGTETEAFASSRGTLPGLETG